MLGKWQDCSPIAIDYNKKTKQILFSYKIDRFVYILPVFVYSKIIKKEIAFDWANKKNNSKGEYKYENLDNTGSKRIKHQRNRTG